MQLGRTLAFTMDGNGAAIGAPDGVHLVTVTGTRPPTFHPTTPIRDMAAVGTEIWVATTTSRLLRFRADGKLRDELPLWGGLGLLRPCVVGARGALWSESPPAVIPEVGAPTAIALSTEPDLVIPVSSTRWVVCHRDRVHLRDPGTERWAIAMGTGGRVVDGAVLFDGRTVALVLASGDHFTQLVVINLHDGAVQHRLTLSGIDLVRFAAVRGFAMLRSQGHSVVMFDLRFGRVLKEHREERAIVDVAIDNAGQTFMLRFGDSHEDIAIGGVRALLSGPSCPAAGRRRRARGERGARRRAARRAAGPISSRHAPARHRALAGAAARADARRHRAGRRVARALPHLARRRWSARRSRARGTRGASSLPAAEGTLPFKAEVSGLLGRLTARAAKEVLESDAEVAKALTETRRAESTLERGRAARRARARVRAVAARAARAAGRRGAGAVGRARAALRHPRQRRGARRSSTSSCVGQILGVTRRRHEIARELDRDARCVRHGLDPAPATAAAAVPRAVAAIRSWSGCCAALALRRRPRATSRIVSRPRDARRPAASRHA